MRSPSFLSLNHMNMWWGQTVNYRGPFAISVSPPHGVQNKNSPKVEKESSGPFETSLKRELAWTFQTRHLFGVWRGSKINLFTLLVEKKTGIPTRRSMHKQPWLSSRKFSHWMINRDPGDEQQRSSLSPFPPKFGCSVFSLLKVNTGVTHLLIVW